MYFFLIGELRRNIGIVARPSFLPPSSQRTNATYSD
jgi:hypothetical protein